MGAGITDIGPQVIALPSITAAGLSSGIFTGLSGTIIGTSVNLLNAGNYCNVMIAGKGGILSGAIQIQIQQSDSDVSGSFVDPTIGILSGDLTNFVTSGGLVTLNPSNGGGVLGGLSSGQAFLSGFVAFAAFNRGGQYVRANVLAGAGVANLQVCFVEEAKVKFPTGGYTWSPNASGVVNV